MRLGLGWLAALGACAMPPGTVTTHEVAASDYHQTYAITVFEPEGPGPHEVIVVLDGDDWTLDVARLAPEKLVVGVGYGEGRNERARDYTPPGPGIPDGYGEVEAFYGFLEADLIPWVDAGWDTVPEAGTRTIVGHSFGGTGALWAVFHGQELFGRVVAVSPSLALGEGAFFTLESEYAATRSDLPVRLHLGAGSLEAHGLAGLTEAFGEVLDERDYEGLALNTELEPGHVHASVFPVAVEHGLAFVTP